MVLTVSFTSGLFLRQAERRPCDQLQIHEHESMRATSSKAPAHGLLPLSLVSVCVYFLQLTGHGQRLSPSTNDRKAETAIRICIKEVKIIAFTRFSFPSNQCQFFCAATIQFGIILSFSPAEQESLYPQPQVHNTAVGNTGILRAGKTSEFFLSPAGSGRKKEDKV